MGWGWALSFRKATLSLSPGGGAAGAGRVSQDLLENSCEAANGKAVRGSGLASSPWLWRRLFNKIATSHTWLLEFK